MKKGKVGNCSERVIQKPVMIAEQIKILGWENGDLDAKKVLLKHIKSGK
jgi:hypothetical protein